ncbi:Alpha/beta hydrolase domain-containing protein 15 [Mactra antiquata]
MADKGVVAIDWYVSSAKLKRNSPILLIFPRLTGDAISVGQICKLGSANGMRAVVVNRRGHGASFMTTAKMTSTGDTKDTRKVVEYIFNNYPYVHIVGIGVGAGCAALLSYLGEYGSSSHLKAAVNISPSYDNTEKLCEQIPKFYELFLLFDLKILLLRYWKALYKVIDLKAAILKSWTLKEFDYHVYCKLYGIETFDSFWCRNDPMRDVDDIAVPVLCINSLDDPVSVKEDIPLDLFEFYPNLLLVTVDKGGHCAFLENSKGESWAAHLAINFVDGVLEFIANSKFWHR